SIILQEPLDVVELDLRPRGVGEAAAQLFQNAAHPLHVHLARDHPGELIAPLTTAQGPAERIGAIGPRLLAAHAVAEAVAGLVAVTLLHGIRKALRALAQRFERLALRVHGGIGIALAEPAAGIAHRAIGLGKAVLAIALIGAGLALIALLARPKAPLGQLVLQLLQAVAQALLVLLQIAHALVALLA